VLLLGCRPDLQSITCDALLSAREGATGGAGSNVLVIITDDVGIDKTAAYGEHPNPASTPNLDALACAGMLFRDTYSNPVCSPSRASLLTGRHGSRTGIGTWIYADTDTFDLLLDEVTIPEMLEASPHGYTSAAVGKWHLASFQREAPGMHPLQQGFSYHAGSLANPLEAVQPGNVPRHYWNWEKNVSGVQEWSDTYMTTDTTNEALGQIETLPEPWFLWVAYNSAHEPLHRPPRALRSSRLGMSPSEDDLFDAMVETVDTEIGRLLAGIPADVLANTTIVYLSDNGTPSHGIRSPWNDLRSKGTVYEGGVNVPFIVVGSHVGEPGAETSALVHFVDLFPTVAEIAEVEWGSRAALATTGPDDHVETSPAEWDQRVFHFARTPLDGRSLLPVLADPTVSLREELFTESFWPNGDPATASSLRMIRDAEWKLLRRDLGDEIVDSFYYLRSGLWDEGVDLMETGLTEATAAEYERLSAALDETRAGLTFAHPDETVGTE